MLGHLVVCVGDSVVSNFNTVGIVIETKEELVKVAWARGGLCWCDASEVVSLTDRRGGYEKEEQ